MNSELSINTSASVLRILSSDKCRTYGIMIRFNDKTRIHYETEISSWHITGKVHHFRIDRKQVYINSEAPSLLVDKLADDLGKVLYPLVAVTNEQGEIRDIANYMEIKERWDKQKEEIIQYYKGEVTARAITSMESSLSDKNTVLQGLKEDWFFNLFFSGIYGLRAYDFREKTIMELPLIPYGPRLKYAVTREITEQHTESKCLLVECKGKLEERRSAEDISLKNPVPVYNALHGHSTTAEGQTYIRYRLYHRDFGIRSITGESSFNDPEEGWRTVSYEIYHQEAKDKPREHYLQQ